MDNKPLDRLLQYTDLSGKQKYKDPNFNQQHGTTNRKKLIKLQENHMMKQIVPTSIKIKVKNQRSKNQITPK